MQSHPSMHFCVYILSRCKKKKKIIYYAHLLTQPAGRPREGGVVIRGQTGNPKPLVTNGATAVRALALPRSPRPRRRRHTRALRTLPVSPSRLREAGHMVVHLQRGAWGSEKPHKLPEACD